MLIQRDDNVEMDYAMVLTEAQQATYEDVDSKYKCIPGTQAGRNSPCWNSNR